MFTKTTNLHHFVLNSQTSNFTIFRLLSVKFQFPPRFPVACRTEVDLEWTVCPAPPFCSFPSVLQWATAGTPAACPPGATSPAAPRSSRATTPSATAWMATATPVWTWECRAPPGSWTDPLPTPHMEVSNLPPSRGVVALSCCWFNSSSHIRFHFYESRLTGL